MVEHVARGAVEQNEGIVNIGRSGWISISSLSNLCETISPGFEAR